MTQYKTIKWLAASAWLSFSVQLPLIAETRISINPSVYQEVVAYLPAKKAKTSAVAHAHIQFELQAAHTAACQTTCKQNWAQQGTLVKKEGPYLTTVTQGKRNQSVWAYKTTRKLDTSSCVSGPVYLNTVQSRLPRWLSVTHTENKAEGIATREDVPASQ